MTKSRKRLSLTVLLATILFGAGIWLGEDTGAPFSTALIPVLLGGGLAGYLAAPGSSVMVRSGAAAIFVLVFVGGWLPGRHVGTVAFNDCVARGEAVRAALAAHRTRRGAFPETLDKLALRDLPGRRLLQGSLLVYRRTAGGYEMQFSDWLVTYRATQAAAFMAKNEAKSTGLNKRARLATTHFADAIQRNFAIHFGWTGRGEIG